jgi:hypothetical protein
MNGNPQLKQAIDLAKVGKKAEAGKILSGILKEQPENEAAWLWMATCLKTNQQKLYCLNQALALNPANETTQKAINKIKASEEKPAEEPEPAKPVQARPKSIVVETHTVQERPKKKKSPYLLPAIGLFAALIIFLLIMMIPKQEQPLTPKQIEGIYLSEIYAGSNNQQTYYMLRFYPDGTVMGAAVIGTPSQVGDMWSVFVYQNNFTLDNKENFPFGTYQLEEDVPDGKLIHFQLQYQYEGHPDYDQRVYSGYINETETYLSECTINNTNCVNRLYERVNPDANP